MVKSGGIEPFVDSIALDDEFYLPTSPEISLKKIFALQGKSCRGIYEIAHAFRNDLSGKFHAREFTMIEWYRRDYNYLQLIDDVMELIVLLDDSRKFEPTKSNEMEFKIISVADLFEIIFQERPKSNWGFDEYRQLAISRNLMQLQPGPGTELGQKQSLMEIFTLLYDHSIIEFGKSTGGIIFIKDYPDFLRGMAKLSGDGWAMRVEAYLHNLELCSGYQELDNADDLRNIWENNNRLREYSGKKIHPIDENLLHQTEKMNGVSGMALGLERTLMAINKINDIREFNL